MFNYKLSEVDYEFTNELRMNRIRYPQGHQRVARKRYFAVYEVPFCPALLRNYCQLFLITILSK